MKKRVTLLALMLLTIFTYVCACAPLGLVINAPGNTDTIDIEPSLQPTAGPVVTASPERTETPVETPVETAVETAAPTPEQTPEQTVSPYSAEDKLVALTFDDGPYKNVTPRILDAVEKYAEDGVHVTFFVLGLQVVQYPAIVARATSLGCEIGNHTYHHKNLTKLSAEDMLEEINDVNEMVLELTDKMPTLVRPPYGARDDSVYAALSYPLILWDIDTLDWSTHDTQSTIDAALKCEDGDIILMHDVHEDTAAAVESIIPGLLERGFKLVTVSELFEAKGIALEPGKSYRHAR